jgi:hypothetical protein
VENSFDAADLAFFDFKQFRNLPGPWFDGAAYPVSSVGSPKIARFTCRVVEETKTEYDPPPQNSDRGCALQSE